MGGGVLIGSVVGLLMEPYPAACAVECDAFSDLVYSVYVCIFALLGLAVE